MKNKKHEIFAQKVAEKGNKYAQKAAIEAGYKKNPEKWAKKLLKDKDIKARIKELSKRENKPEKEVKTTRKVGRPTLYKQEYNDLAFKYCLLGATDKQLAEFFDVDEATINKWKIDFPEFYESIKKGKQKADAEVAEALYNRARGYKHKEDKIFNNNGEAMIVKTTKHYPPDTAAAMAWLKNRQPKQWRDKQEIESKNENNNKLTIEVKSQEDAKDVIRLLDSLE